MRFIDADALYNGAMKDEYFDYVEHDNHGRESFAYSCAMARLAEAPTIPAIPIDWIFEQMQILHELHNKNEHVLQWLMDLWQKEQEARDNGRI